jgi:uncharacterized protein (TIGR03435 family)
MACSLWIKRVVLIGVAFSLLCFAQPFEVASIRPNMSDSPDSNVNSLPEGRVIVTNESVRSLIRLAFRIKDYQIDRAPAWIDTARYDINAKGSGELYASLRLLFADRFALRSHMETRELIVYSLEPGKNGLKMTRHDDGTGTVARASCGHLLGKRVTSAVIATMLSRQIERDVTDNTGLAGKYDFELTWTPDTGACRESDSPSLFTAVQEQLGLRLDSKKGPTEILVIDHIERPSEN